MSEDLRVTPEVKALVDNIILEYNLIPVLNVEYSPGSKPGDGYACATIAVKITSLKGSLELFIKCALNVLSNDQLSMEKFYANEIYFYDIVYPAYQKFVEEQDVKQAFKNVPKCYGTINRRTIAFENLQSRNFTLFERSRHMNRAHIELVLRTLAKFHAVSFAHKDQERQKYDELVRGTYNAYSKENGVAFFLKLVREEIEDCLEKLDPIQDNEILGRCQVEDLMCAFTSAEKNLNEYSILSQGDCWSNNIMFSYEVS